MTQAAAIWRDAAEEGARGNYVAAWALLDVLGDSDARWQSLAASMRGSHLRQIGDVRAARTSDAHALERACDPESRAEALIGLAADDVADARAAAAREHLALAVDDAECAWRTRTRLAWVTAELALLEGAAEAGIEAGERALQECADHSARHAAKSLLITEAARGGTPSPDLVGQGLVRAVELIRTGGWVSLQWPAALIADDLVRAQRATPQLVSEAADIRAEGASAVRTIGQALPPALREGWLGGPAARRLLASDG